MNFRLRQRGFGAVIFIALVALLIVGVLLSALAGKSSQNQMDERSLPALAAAQQALIAYAASHPTAPGRLPCPDTTNTGVADLTCGAAGVNQLGRLPWKTLGLPDLRDGSGECLWYAVSGAFKENPATAPVNSDTNGQFIIVDGAGNTIAGAIPQTQAIAVVFAPGPTLPTNDRTAAGTTQCGGNTTASNYLDTSGVVNNAAPAGAFRYLQRSPRLYHAAAVLPASRETRRWGDQESGGCLLRGTRVLPVCQ
jgi:type II secretory pathway pseudopilin PulG